MSLTGRSFSSSQPPGLRRPPVSIVSALRCSRYGPWASSCGEGGRAGTSRDCRSYRARHFSATSIAVDPERAGRQSRGRGGRARPWPALPLGAVGVIGGCLAIWRDALRTGLSGDTFWHVAVGRWMLDHHRLLTSDVFSYTAAGRPWHTPEWGYDVLLAGSIRTMCAR